MNLFFRNRYRITFDEKYKRYYAQIKFWYWPIWWFNIHESGDFLYDSAMWEMKYATQAIAKYKACHKGLSIIRKVVYEE